MLENNYTNLIQEILTKKWSTCEQPVVVHDSKNLNVGIELLANIAKKSISQPFKDEDIKEDEIVASREIESQEEIVRRVKSFVEEKAFTFRGIVQSGFPFALVEKTSAEIALNQSLKNQTSILFHFMQLENAEWLNEEQLNQSFFAHRFCDQNEIPRACFHLARSYIQKADLKAGYYLLWLIKKTAGCNYAMPEKNSFNGAIVCEVLSQFFENSGKLQHSKIFIEILFYRPTKKDICLYHSLLDRHSMSIFFGFTGEQLRDIPINTWENKRHILVQLLAEISLESRIQIASNLAASKDEQTEQIGSLLSKIFPLNNFKEAEDLLFDLEKLLPNLDNVSIEKIFGFEGIYPLKQFQNSPINEEDFIGLFSGKGSRKDNICNAKILSSSNVKLNAFIGNQVLAAFYSNFYPDTLTHRHRDAFSHFNILMELLPNLKHSHIEEIFGVVFPEMREVISGRKDPNFAKRLNFTDPRIFIHDHLMIGIYDPRLVYGKTRISPHLLAYDMKSEKLVWGIPLNATLSKEPFNNKEITSFGFPSNAVHDIHQIGEFLAIQLEGSKNLFLIKPETGECLFNVEVPFINRKYIPQSLSRASKDLFYYQMGVRDGERVLLGGSIVDGVWNQVFEKESVSGFFQFLSTHCGLRDVIKNEITIFGPTGNHAILPNCLSAFAQDDKLYTIEKHPRANNKSFLKIRTLLKNENVVSPIENSFFLDAKKPSIEKVCKNGQVVLLADSRPIFVDLKQEIVCDSDSKISQIASHTISESGEIWTWDVLSEKVKKISSEGEEEDLGLIKGFQRTKLLHVDDSGQLYFADNL